jgi:N-acyl-D-amino-acid deacylase
MPDPRTVLRGGTVVDGSGGAPRRADLAVRGARIEAIGAVPAEPGDSVLDVTGRYLLPGFIDAHTHADAAVFLPDVQRGLLRQGVTSVVAGQDGVSYAPGDGTYGASYFAAINGLHPTYAGGGVADLLSSYDGSTPVNVGYLVPAGTVRHQVRGFAPGRATPDELTAMAELVKVGLDEGALGLSTGLDYVPNAYAATAELIELCRPLARAGALYVTHMRGGYEHNSGAGVAEVAEIALATGVSVHVSHYHGPSGLLLDLVDDLAARGVDMSFDNYPYRRGCTVLAMPILPTALLDGPNAEVATRLRDPSVRADLLDSWFPLLEKDPDVGPEWPDNFTIAHVAAPAYDWAHGLTVRAAADRAGVAPAAFSLDLLAASRLEVSVVMKVRDQRPYDDLARLITHDRQVVGSDGVYVGAHPHPRAWGTFAKVLRVFTRERGDLSWAEAAVHLSGRTARRYGLSDRGRLRPGYVADIAVVDPETVADRSRYEDPRREATGIDDVFVGGRQVLAGGELTGVNAGRGLRRSAPVG